jgi:hypothetical protein
MGSAWKTRSKESSSLSPANCEMHRFKDVLPAHKFVVKHLGYCPCDGLCDVETAIRLQRKKQKLKEVSVDWEMLRHAVPPVLKDAREDLVHFYGINLEDLLKNPSAVFLSSGPPGIGKTHLMLRLGTLSTHGCVHASTRRVWQAGERSERRA